jgi:hypothetical protein
MPDAPFDGGSPEPGEGLRAQPAQWVLHVDLDQFLAAVEILRRPELAGRPLIVGGRGDPTERAVVSTASYEARAFGIRSGMPLKTAVRRCPDAILLPVDFPVYEAASAEVMDTLRQRPGAIVQVLGWDEAFVGVSTKDPEAYAREVQAAVRAATRLSCSGGDRGHHGAGQDRHRVRQAGRDLPADPGQLVRGDGGAADYGTVGRGQAHRGPPRRSRHPFGRRPGPGRRGPAGHRVRTDHGPVPAGPRPRDQHGGRR